MKAFHSNIVSHMYAIIFSLSGFILIMVDAAILPLFTPKTCSEICGPGAYTMSILDALQYQFQGQNNAFTIITLLLPLIMAALIICMVIWHLFRPSRILLRLLLAWWLLGLLPFLGISSIIVLFNDASAGFWGIVAGYGLFFIGYRLLLSGKIPQQYSAPLQISAPALVNKGMFFTSLGFFVVEASALLVPAFVSNNCQSDYCSRYHSPSIVEDIFNQLRFSFIFIPHLLALVLPVVMAILLLGMSVFFSLHPNRRLLHWILSGWLVGIAPFLLLFVVVVFQNWFPSYGYFGIIIGYSLLLVSHRTFVISAQQSKYAQ